MSAVRASLLILFPLAIAACATSRTPTTELTAADAQVSIRLMLIYDANQDGKVTREELEAGLRREFMSADRDGDGQLSVMEMQAENDRRFRANGPAASPLIDWNQDGIIDMTEFSTTARSAFEQLDRDRDNVLDGAELRPPRPPQPGAMGRGGRR